MRSLSILSISLLAITLMWSCKPDPTCPSGLTLTEDEDGNFVCQEVSDDDLVWDHVDAAYEPGALLSVWIGGPDDIWFVGGEADQALVLHFDGESWISEDPGVDVFLRWVHGFSDGTVFAVGDNGAIVRFDGSSWEVMDSGAPGTTFWGVWGSSPDDVYAVGAPWLQAPEDIDKEGDVAVHFDGTSWTRIAIDYLETERETSTESLYKVWGTGPDHVFIVGSEGLTLRFDGVEWFAEPIPDGLGGPIWTVDGFEADNMYAVGGFSVTFLIRWDGEKWNEVPLGNTPPLLMQGVWVDSNNDVFVSGMDGYTARRNTSGQWDEFESTTEYVYHAIRGDGQGGFYACGGDISALKEDYTGIISVSGTSLPKL